MLYVSISQVILLLLKLFLKDCLSTTEAIGNLKNTKKFLHKSGSVSFDLSWMFICRPNIYIIHPSLLLTFIRKKIRIMKKTISITQFKMILSLYVLFNIINKPDGNDMTLNSRSLCLLIFMLIFMSKTSYVILKNLKIFMGPYHG